MRERSLKRTSVLLAVLFGLVTALTGFALFFGGGSTHASADEGTAVTEKALYYVDCGYLTANKDGTGDVKVRGCGADGTLNYPSVVTTPFMTAYGLTYGNGTTGLYNSVSDKPYVYTNDSTLWSTVAEGSSADPVTEKNWGFTTGTSDYGWQDWRSMKTNINDAGYEYSRHTEGSEGPLTYTFQVDNATDALRVHFGTATDWASDWQNNQPIPYSFSVAVNSVSKTGFQSKRQAATAYTWDEIVYGQKNNDDNNYYVTISFGSASENVHISWILVSTANYAIDVEAQTACVKGGTTGSVDLMPISPSNADVNQLFYARGTLDETEMAKINAADDFAYVENVKVTLNDGREKTVRVLALPSHTKYFVNAGYDAAYGATHGYGYTGYTGNENKRKDIGENVAYNASLRHVAANGTITYKFDNLPAGAYGIKVANKDPWENRVTPITINGVAGTDLQSATGQDRSVVNYTDLSEAGDITVELLRKDGTGNGPCLSYIWVYEAEAVITYDTQGGSKIVGAIRDPGATTSFTVTSEVPSKQGHIFLGWYTLAEGGDKVEAGTEITEVTTLYAHWQEALPHDVTFMADGATHATAENITYNTVIPTDKIPPVPTKPGYYFAGWADSNDALVDLATFAVTEDTTLTAKWIVDPLAEEDEYTVLADEDGSAVSTWSGDLHHDGKRLYLPNGKKAVAVMNVSNGNGGNKGLLFSYRVVNGNKSTVYNSAPYSTYCFNNHGWTTGGNWGNSKDNATASTLGDAGITISVNRASNHGVYYEDPNLALTQVGVAELNGTSLLYTLTTYEVVGTYWKELCKTVHTITLPSAVAELEYMFAFDADSGQGHIPGVFESASIKYFTLNNTEYSVTFDSQGGSSVTAATVRGTQKVTKPADPTKTGYTFGGWYKEAACTTAWNFAEDTVTADVTLYAKWTVSQYTVTFDTQGGSTVAAATVEHNNKVTKPADPTRDGYRFDGWYKEAACTTAWNFDTEVITADVTIYAKWTQIFTVSFDLNYTGATGTPTAITGIETGAVIPASSKPTDPSRTGYTFGGWYTDAACAEANKFTFGTTDVTANVTLYAKWTANTYDITYNLDGGTNHADNTATYTYGAGLTLEDPTKTGYEFKGWFTDAELTNEVTAISATDEGNKTLYAKWEANTYTITFDVQGGDALVTTTMNVTYGQAVGELPTPTYTGNRFEGWYLETSHAHQITAETVWTYAEDKTLYAYWVDATVVTYTVSFNLNGATDATPINAITGVVAGNTVSLDRKPTNPTRPGYVFVAWHINQDHNSEFVFGETVVNGNITLYAHWDAETYTVTWDVNGGTAGATNGSATVTYAAAFDLPSEPTKDNYDFAGWYTELTGGTQVTAGNWAIDAGENNASITIYARWTPKTYTISYVLNGGENPLDAATSYVYGVGLTSLPVPTREGYTFVDWHIGADYTEGGAQGIDSIGTTQSGNLELHAHWEANQYNITYNLDGGANPDGAPMKYTCGVGVPTLPVPTKTGYDFDGWYTEASGGTKVTSISTTQTGDIALYAHWTEQSVTPPPAAEYTVTFNSQGGSTVASATVESGNTVAKPTDPTRDGYTFGGWYTDANCTTAWNFDTDTVTADVTLYAKWTANSTPAPAPAPSDEGGKKKGCGSSVMAETSVCLAVLMLALAGVVVLKKKAENK